MDDIRRFSAELAIQTVGKSYGVQVTIEGARLWDAYLREKIPGAEQVQFTEDGEQENPMVLTEESVLAAMLGDNPEVLNVLRDAAGLLSGIDKRAEKVFDPDD